MSTRRLLAQRTQTSIKRLAGRLRQALLRLLLIVYFALGKLSNSKFSFLVPDSNIQVN
jgi:hypothetical protein